MTKFSIFILFRWWVANHGSQHAQIPVSKNIFDGCKQSVYKLRLILRFLLGALHPYYKDINCKPQYRIIDKYMLYLLFCYNEQVIYIFYFLILRNINAL